MPISKEHEEVIASGIFTRRGRERSGYTSRRVWLSRAGRAKGAYGPVPFLRTQCRAAGPGEWLPGGAGSVHGSWGRCNGFFLEPRVGHTGVCAVCTFLCVYYTEIKSFKKE